MRLPDLHLGCFHLDMRQARIAELLESKLKLIALAAHLHVFRLRLLLCLELLLCSLASLVGRLTPLCRLGLLATRPVGHHSRRSAAGTDGLGCRRSRCHCPIPCSGRSGRRASVRNAFGDGGGGGIDALLLKLPLLYLLLLVAEEEAFLCLILDRLLKQLYGAVFAADGHRLVECRGAPLVDHESGGLCFEQKLDERTIVLPRCPVQRRRLLFVDEVNECT
mmetsp:Transcript_26681/g.67864  ORF Transcript_26681/g.67864 Transcript_26681/m.67864 type:complete len:221 (+) Transcript_26681:390-1052(+)